MYFFFLFKKKKYTHTHQCLHLQPFWMVGTFCASKGTQGWGFLRWNSGLWLAMRQCVWPSGASVSAWQVSVLVGWQRCVWWPEVVGSGVLTP